MSSNNYQKQFLIIFDFDETIIDNDSEDELLKNIFSKEEYDEINKELINMDFFEGFNYYFKRMKELGITLTDLNKNLEKIQLSPKMEELFGYLRKNIQKYEIIICSNAVDYEIKHILKFYGILDLFNDFICSKAIIQDEKSESLLFVPKNQFPHSCDICSPYQCKGFELKKYIEKNKKQYEKIIFICDGSNDYCPSKKVLKKGDIVFPRRDHRLYEKLFKEELSDQLTCEIYPWRSAEEIIVKLEQF